MLIVDLQYFPPVSFFSASYKETNLLIYEYDLYRKMSFRNRCLIAGANNIIDLSIPLEGGRQQKAAIKEIRLSGSQPWQKQHWRSLHSAYNRSPFFEHYAPELERMYQEKQVWLYDWNRNCLEWIKEKTGWPPVLTYSETNDVPAADPEKVKSNLVTDWRNRLLPKNYLSFDAPVYQQVFQERWGFQANLSVLDLLFNTGPESREYLAGEKNR